MRVKTLILLFFVFIALPALSQSRYDAMFHKKFADRSLVFDTLVLHELSGLPEAEFNKRMDTLLQKAKRQGDYGAELQILLGRYQYLQNRDLTDINERIVSMEGLLKTLKNKNYPEYQALVALELGNNYFRKKQNYIQAFENYVNAYNLVKDADAKDFPKKKKVLVNLGNSYYNFGEIQKAKELLLDADKLPRSEDTLTNYNNKNTLGLVYRHNKMYDSAIYYFNETWKLAKKDGKKVWCSIAMGNIGTCYYLQGKYDMALPLLNNDIEGCIANGKQSYDNALTSLMTRADIHLKQSKPAEMANDIRLAERYIDSTMPREWVKHYAALYRAKAGYYQLKGDYKTAYAFQDSAKMFADSLALKASMDNVAKILRLEFRQEVERQIAELKQLSAEKKLLQLTRNILLAGIVIVFVITVILVNRQKLRNKLKQSALIADRKLAEQELINATEKLEIYTRRLQEKNAIIEQTTREIEKIQSTVDANETSKLNNEAILQLQHSTILTEEEWMEFKELFEQVHVGFLQRLKEKMPGLTPADTRFLVLTRLKLSNKEMAGILGVQPDSIRTSKYRLRKKFSLDDDSDITALVSEI